MVKVFKTRKQCWGVHLVSWYVCLACLLIELYNLCFICFIFLDFEMTRILPGLVKKEECSMKSIFCKAPRLYCSSWKSYVESHCIWTLCKTKIRGLVVCFWSWFPIGGIRNLFSFSAPTTDTRKGKKKRIKTWTKSFEQCQNIDEYIQETLVKRP